MAAGPRQRTSKPSRGKSERIPPPTGLTQDLWGAWKSFTLAAAMDLDVFSHIASGKHTAAAVAAAAGAHESSLQRLLDALVALRYLRRNGSDYLLTPVAATYLVRGSELYMEGGAQFTRRLVADWSQLAQVIRSGEPLVPGQGDQRPVEPWTVLVKAIFPTSFVAAKAAAKEIGGAARKRISRILDVAAGSGAWSLAFAQAIPRAKVTVVDFPAVTAITREYAARYGAGKRYSYIEGSIRDVDFGKNRYDLAILGHIVHSEGREWGRKLIEKAAASLREKGLLLIGEFVPADNRGGPPIPMLFGLNMLIHVRDGDVFTMRDYRAWLKGAGFKSVRRLAVPAPSPLILASK